MIDTTIKTLVLHGDTITVKQLKQFLADIPDDVKIEIDGSGSGYVTDCKLEYYHWHNIDTHMLTLDIDAESCYY